MTTDLLAAGTLRFATAGSVDDGKSTLIGRLLYDAKGIMADQLDQVAEVSRRRGAEGVDLALVTDGLRAEREQGITIDVAYRYFATPNRRFIIADTPGHQQYTRNMVTGASTADLALILVDARNGLTEQSRRHATIASLLGIPQVVVCVNKMDLVGWDEGVFDSIVRDFDCWARDLPRPVHASFIPICALDGDNVVERSDRLPWYGGPALLEFLEAAEPARAGANGSSSLRLPVQWVVRGEPRRYTGRIASGAIAAGDEVVVLPSGLRTRVTAVHGAGSVGVELADDVDCGRGDVLAAVDDPPSVTRSLTATLCWLGDQPARARGRYLLKLGTTTVRARIEELVDRVSVETLDREAAPEQLALNEIGTAQLRLAADVVCDPYGENRAMGAFILIDEQTNDTVAAGMVERTSA